MARSTASAFIHKFGGAALADADAIRHAARIIAARPQGAVVVASAMRGVTDALLHIAILVSRGEQRAARAAAEALRARHLETAAELAVGNGQLSTAGEIDREFGDLTELMARIVVGLLDAAITDAVAARGERMSASMLAAARATQPTAPVRRSTRVARRAASCWRGRCPFHRPPRPRARRSYRRP